MRVNEPESDEASVAWFGWVLELKGGDSVMTTTQRLLARQFSAKKLLKLSKIGEEGIWYLQYVGKGKKAPLLGLNASVWLEAGTCYTS